MKIRAVPGRALMDSGAIDKPARPSWLALLAGVIAGISAGFLLGLTKPSPGLDSGSAWILRAVLLAVCGAIVGAVTSIISWKHRPGLPGFAWALSLIGIGVLQAALQDADSEPASIHATESLLALLSTLAVY